MERGPPAEPDKHRGETCVAALQTWRPKVTIQDGLKRKLINEKQFMADSHVLGSDLYLN